MADFSFLTNSPGGANVVPPQQVPSGVVSSNTYPQLVVQIGYSVVTLNNLAGSLKLNEVVSLAAREAGVTLRPQFNIVGSYSEGRGANQYILGGYSSGVRLSSLDQVWTRNGEGFLTRISVPDGTKTNGQQGSR